MRPVRVVLNAAGFSPWIPVNYLAEWFGVGVGVVLSEDANLTYTVQHTFDSVDPSDYLSNSQVRLARAAGVVTVTDLGPYGIGHGLSLHDSVLIASSGSSQMDSASPVFGQGQVGWDVASIISPTSFTYVCQNAGPTADSGSAQIARLRVFNSNLAAQTARGTTTYNYGVRAIRLAISLYTAGFADMTVLQSSR